MARTRLHSENRKWLMAGAALVLAGGVGFGVARFTAPQRVSPPAVAGKQEHAGEAKGAEAEEGGGEEGHVAMDATRIQTAGIQILATTGGALSAEISAQGTITPQPQGEAVLAARADGVVTRINRRLGDFVRAGEAVATIESREASTIAADRASAAARAIAARQVYDREQRLFGAGISPRQDLEAAQATRAQAEAEVRRTTSAAAAARVSSDGRSVAVVSPIAGRITVAPAVLGSYVAAGAELFRVADAARIEVQAAVSGANAQRIAAGDSAVVESPAGPVSAVVRSITPGVDAESRAATVVLTLTGNSTALRPGQAVRVRLAPRANGVVAGRVVVPEEAVQTVEGREVVFVRNAEGFEAVPVTVGARGGGRAEVTSGLTAGQSIAARGAFLLKAELGKGDAEHGH